MLDEPHTAPSKADIEASRVRLEGRGKSKVDAVAVSPVPADATDPCVYRHHERRTPPDHVFPDRKSVV